MNLQLLYTLLLLQKLLILVLRSREQSCLCDTVASTNCIIGTHTCNVKSTFFTSFVKKRSWCIFLYIFFFFNMLKRRVPSAVSPYKTIPTTLLSRINTFYKNVYIHQRLRLLSLHRLHKFDQRRINRILQLLIVYRQYCLYIRQFVNLLYILLI